ncbi:MAG: CAP domain-containing protein [bacterium]
MNESKSALFFVFLVTALIVAGYILYTKQTATPSSIVSDPIVNTGQEVKGESVNSTNTAAITKTVTGSEFTKKNASLRTKINRENIIWFTNYERAKVNLPPLTASAQLNTSSSRKNDDMFVHQYFNHTRAANPPIGFDRFIDDQNYTFIKIGENLAMGDFSSSAEIVNAWMKSPAHKKNILDPIYRDIGVTATLGTMNGKEVYLITQHFGDPRSSCPSINATTKEAIDALKNHITELQTTINEKQQEVTRSNHTLDPHYDSLIEEYNSFVTLYNNAIKQMASLVSTYNKQVQSFDRCVQGKG